MRNPQAGALSCLLQVIQVFHVIHVFQVFPMRACVAGDGHAGVDGVVIQLGASPCAEAMNASTRSFV